MPASPRNATFDPTEVGIYHCWNRCVRGAWLCGVDPVTGIDYSYRREWIEKREVLLAGLFGIDICFHAEMSNHLHLILRNRPDVVEGWSDREVVRRMLSINRLTKSLDGEFRQPTEAEINSVLSDPQRVAKYRLRLSDISWFMASLCEHISRRINVDAGQSGTLWEGRFKCRALEDEAAVLICGIYIDLNQIRIGEAQTPEASTHTSAYQRILRYQQESNAVGSGQSLPAALPDAWLAELTLDEGPNADLAAGLSAATPHRCSDKGLLPITAQDYFELLDWSGRQIAAGKRGAIPADLAPILERLHIQPSRWLETVIDFEQLFGRIVGRAEAVGRRAAATGYRWIRGITSCRAVFN